MKASFAKQEAPLIVDVIREKNIRDVIAVNYEQLHLKTMVDAFRTMDWKQEG